MSNVDQALQIMSDYWDAAYCEGNTGINQSANANDCLHRMRQLLQAHDGEVVYQVCSNVIGWHQTDIEGYESWHGERRILYTAPRAAVDEAMEQRAIQEFESKSGYSPRERVRAALKAALEKPDAS